MPDSSAKKNFLITGISAVGAKPQTFCNKGAWVEVISCCGGLKLYTPENFPIIPNCSGAI